MTSYAEATAVKQVGSHTYELDLVDDWSIGSVPHGGYVAASLLSATALHFKTTHASYKQPHCLTLHISFLRRTSTGRATIKIEDLKLGALTSVVQVTLSQEQVDSKSKKTSTRTEVTALITHANLHKPMTGGLKQALTLPTNWSLDPPPPAVDLAQLSSKHADPNWTSELTAFPKFRKAHLRYEHYIVRRDAAGPIAAGYGHPSVNDEWMRLAPVKGTGAPQMITQTTLGSVADMFPLIIEQYRLHLKEHGSEAEKKEVAGWPPFWCPTVVLNLEVKRALPEEGLEWVFVRVRAKELREGRLDLEALIYDAEGRLLAISAHTAFVLSAGRNLQARGEKKGGKGGGESQTQEERESKL